MRHTHPSHPTPIHAELTVALQDWFERSARSLPWRATRDPYKVLVSEFMLQQTQVVTVIPYFLRWIQRFPDFHSLAAADEQQVLRAWALICTSGTPSCHRCPVNDRCPSRDNAAALPVKRRKPAPQRKDEFALWNLDRHGILLELRAGPRWRGLWTLPQITEPSVSTTPLIVHRFGVTRFQISLHILSSGHPITTKRADRGPGVQRIPLAEIADLPLAAPHRRVINDLLGQLDA